MIFNCPGSQKFKQPYPESISCGNCGKDVEIWTDEKSAVCPHCGCGTKRAREQSCLDWCKYANLCAGYRLLKPNGIF